MLSVLSFLLGLMSLAAMNCVNPANGLRAINRSWRVAGKNSKTRLTADEFASVSSNNRSRYFELRGKSSLSRDNKSKAKART